MTPLLTCAAARRRLAAFHDRELPVTELIAVEAHLDGCPPCASEAAILAGIGAALRGAVAATPVPTDALSGLQPVVVSRMKAEDDLSWRAQLGRLFDDLHLVWIGLASVAATLVCAAIASLCFYFASPERDDSLAALIAALASAEENHMRVDSRTFFPRVAADDVVPAALVRSMSEEEAVLTLAAVVTREGRLVNLEVLDNPANRQRVIELLDAISAARFEPARVSGWPVSTNLVWLLAHTTVHGKIS